MKIVVIEDQVMMRSLIVRVCREQRRVTDVGEAGDGQTGVEACRKLRPDMVLLDIDLPDGDGLDRLAEIRRLAPDARILVVTSHVDDYAIHRSFEARVFGFIDKSSHSGEIVAEAIQTVAAGRVFISPVVARARARLREDPHAFSKLLTEREQELLRYFGEGLSDDEVAERISGSAKTVHTHRRNIMFKLGIHSTPRLIRYAIEKGFTRLRGPQPASS